MQDEIENVDTEYRPTPEQIEHWRQIDAQTDWSKVRWSIVPAEDSRDLSRVGLPLALIGIFTSLLALFVCAVGAGLALKYERHGFFIFDMVLCGVNVFSFTVCWRVKEYWLSRRNK